MNPTPEAIKYQPASNIELLGIAYVVAVASAVFTVSNVDGFTNGQAVVIMFPDGTLLAGTLAASNAVSAAAKTLTFTEAPVLPTGPPEETVFAGASIFGPPLLQLGGTNGGVRFIAKPDMVNVEYDQVEGDVDAIPVHWNVSAAFTLMEFDLKQWGYLSQMGYSVRAAGAGINAAVIVDFQGHRVQRFGARFTFDKQDPSENVLKDYLYLYKVASLEGIETSMTKRDPTNLPVTFKGLADPARPRGKRFYDIVQETAAGT